MSIVVRGVPYRLQEPGEYEGDDIMSFRVTHPELPEVKAGGWEEAFECKNGMIPRIQEAAENGEVISMRVAVQSKKSKEGKPWSLLQVREIIAE